MTRFISSIRKLPKFTMASCFILIMGSAAQAATLGVNLVASDNWSIGSNSGFTLGYEFKVNGTENVSGLGFWDKDGIYSSTTVGLWKTDGTLLGTANTGLSTVRTVAISGGPGAWYFMDFATTLGPGSYVVGSHGGAGMDYAYGGSITTSILTFLDAREQSGDIFFSFPPRKFIPVTVSLAVI